MKNTRPTVFHEDQPEGPAIKPGMKSGGGDGPADAGHDCSANAGKLRAGNAQGGMSRRVAPVPEAWESRNSHDSYELAIRLIREEAERQRHAGETVEAALIRTRTRKGYLR